MVFRLEESIAAAVFESRRYLVYAAESLLVVLVEAPAVSSSSARDQAKSASRFELWQVWNAQDPIRCVRFNSSKKVARGALALCIDEGRGVLLMPASATSSRAAAMAEASRASTLGDAGSDLIPRSDYVKAHLHLHLPRWAESWVESGDDLFLLGAGEKMSIWKLVDDSVHVYLQRTVTLSSGGGLSVESPLPVVPVCHFDVAPSGRFAATAGKHDRVVKLWNLGELSPHEVSQRMDSITQMNAKLLGDRCGAVADTHVGETFICGNVALEKTFAVHLTYGVLSNGDFCIFRVESIPFSRQLV
uniref:Uncharacterized protein n=1 Tax=Phytophthora ramorum TaxID=164328 RepID=H3HE58_PHYRM